MAALVGAAVRDRKGPGPSGGGEWLRRVGAASGRGEWPASHAAAAVQGEGARERTFKSAMFTRLKVPERPPSPPV